ncbi:hypothetical protein [Tropicimonas marinistellae]|uniref:hypothetical protein n=1 Tax=Tropicimonas marinistellae TaxID=1739787 RepID=UPI00083218E9|nr:hypothetical protein [Tropicimonas marinistellae]
MDKRKMSQAEAAQSKLQSMIGEHSGVVGLGIGLDHSRKGLALKVLLDGTETDLELPEEIDGIPVETSVTGPISAN